MNMNPCVLFLLLLLAFGLAVDTTHAGSPTGQAGEPEAISLFGKPLYAMELGPEQEKELERKLAEEMAALDEDPRSPERIIWVGRRLAYLGRYREAIDVFTKGIEMHPKNYSLYRHRGHRYITVREFDKAIEDLEKSASLSKGVPDEVEEDGAPNAAGIPRSTSHSNIWYHLGLAYYLEGDFDNALRSYKECMNFSKINDDMLVATADWLYMTYRRLGREKEAGAVLDLITEEMDILENSAYHQRLLMYKGTMKPEEVLGSSDLDELNLLTQGYGVANWYYVNGDKARAKVLLEKIMEGSYWPAFGYIAAEADLKRWPTK